MPALYTHYTCGLLNYRAMKKGYLKECIRAAEHAYSIGLAGPDIFFYSIPDRATMKESPGSLLHVEKTGEFLQHLFQEISLFKGHAKTIATAYFAGFVGHYELDCACHPIVYEHQDEEHGFKAMGQHFRYEAAMDAYCCETYLNRDMNEMNAAVLTDLTLQEKRVIARMVERAYRHTFPEKKVSNFNMETVLSCYKLVTMLILDPAGWKEKLMLPVEKMIFKCPFASPLFINRNRYDVTEEDWKAFQVCFEQGRGELKKVTPHLERALLNPLVTEAFFDVLGNKSYHTGKPLEES